MKVAAKRKPISKAVRHEILKRDSFTCQYCGKSAPDVVLEIEHIIPVSKGGDNETLNLITACFDCNRGKGNKLLSDDTMIKKQKKQLKELNERKEQLKLLIEWKKELLTIENQSVEYAVEYWNTRISGTKACLTEIGKNTVKKMIMEFGLNSVLEAMDKAMISYISENMTPQEAGLAFSKISGICFNKKNKSHYSNVRYLIAVMRNRYSYYQEDQAIRCLTKALDKGHEFEDLKKIIIDCQTWENFLADLSRKISEV